jgi:hypothetical protein
LVFKPLAGIDGEQPADFDGEIGGGFGERDEDEALPDGDLIGGIDDEIVGEIVHFGL